SAKKSAESKDEAEMLIEIKGQILDYQSKKTIEKVEIKLKNTNNKTYSDKFGNFSLQISEKNATLVLSKAGYLTQEVSNLTNQKLTIFLQVNP
ncbi:MAG: carboxypeptidase-like regulatory domain-containing protein, partial [Thermonemataceae bacterium]|nr:carboxypeptidase-like regulatory domain-containing protein [Thermonemataceae bacterium]